MSHNEWVRPGGVWSNPLVPAPRDLQRLDVAQLQGLNGDAGGTWNPVNPIVIGGSGLQTAGPLHTMTGGVTTSRGGRIMMGASTFPSFSAPRTRSLVVPLVGLHTGSNGDVRSDDIADPSGTVFVNNAVSIQQQILQRYIHNGATLTTAVLSFRVGRPHLGIPANLPAFQIDRYSQGHTSASLVTLGNAAVLPAPASADAYYANGAVQTLTFTCTQNNAIDAGLYQYPFIIFDEKGTNSVTGNIYTSITLNYTAIADMHFE